MAFAMPWRPRDERVVVCHSGLLRRLWNAIYVGAQRNDRLALAPGSHPGGWNSSKAALELKTFFFENPRKVLGGLHFLKTKLGEAEHHVVHHLRLLLHAIYLPRQIGLQGCLARRVSGGQR